MPDNIIPITTRPSVSSSVPTPQKLNSKFPTEVINLPSKGWFYPPESPLSSGNIELKMITALEEDILTSRNLLDKNIVLDKLLESIIIDKKIHLDDMFSCDRNAIFFATRQLAYGNEYKAKMSCGRCNKESEIVIDLGKIDNKPFDFEKYPKGVNNFEFTLPHSKAVINYKLLTKKDENLIEEEMNNFKKITKEFTKEVTTRLKHIIVSVNGSSDKSLIRKFVEQEFLAKDSMAFRKHLRENMPDIDTSFDFICSNCGVERREETMPMGISFFWPERGI